MTPSGTTILGQSEPGSNSNEGVLQISKAGASLSDGLMSYPGHSLGQELTLPQKSISQPQQTGMGTRKYLIISRMSFSRHEKSLKRKFRVLEFFLLFLLKNLECLSDEIFFFFVLLYFNFLTMEICIELQ